MNHSLHFFPPTNNFSWEKCHIVSTVTTNCIVQWTSVSDSHTDIAGWVLMSELVFRSSPTTKELEITGMLSFYYWNTGKLYHHAGKFCIFWNIGTRVMLAHKATWNTTSEEKEKCLFFSMFSGTCEHARLRSKSLSRTIFLFSRCELQWYKLFFFFFFLKQSRKHYKLKADLCQSVLSWEESYYAESAES